MPRAWVACGASPICTAFLPVVLLPASWLLCHGYFRVFRIMQVSVSVGEAIVHYAHIFNACCQLASLLAADNVVLRVKDLVGGAESGRLAA